MGSVLFILVYESIFCNISGILSYINGKNNCYNSRKGESCREICGQFDEKESEGAEMADCITMMKYQGLGNDYLVLDPHKNRVELAGRRIALMCRRGFGLGADGVLYGPVEINGKMGVRIFNSDGTESAISGNGVRIFAKYLMDQEYVKEKKFSIETLSGPIEVECLNSRATEFRANMGKASFLSREIPVTGEVREVVDEAFSFGGGEYRATCLTVGNPHCIVFMDEISGEKVKKLGPYVENAEEFPDRMNLQICRKIDTGNLEIEIWERGSGYTKASGTGSCAAAAAAYRLGLVERRVNVNQPGGMIQIDIQDDGTLFMTGSVGYVADVRMAASFFS